MKHRLELFSDAIFAIIITVMLLDLHAPETAGWSGWVNVLPSIAAYVVTFLFLLIVWAAHHHMFSHLREFNRRMYWFNGVALLLASLIPLTVRNYTEHPQDPVALVLYLMLALGVFNSLTGVRFAANAAHKDDPGWKAWSKKRNRMSFTGNLVQIGIIGLAFFSIRSAIALWVLLLCVLVASI